MWLKMYFLKVKLIFITVTLFILCNSNDLFGNDKKSKIDSVNGIPYATYVSHLQKYLQVFKKNLSQAKAINYKFGIAKSNENLGIIYALSSKYEKSLESTLNAIRIYEDEGKIAELCDLYGNYGYTLKSINRKRGKFYLNKGIELAEKNNLKFQLTKLYDNYGVLQEMDNKLDSAMFYYKKSLNLQIKLQDSVGIPYSFNNIAGIYAMQGNFKKAFDYMHKSDKYRYLEKGDFGRAENLVIYADIYSQIPKIDSAIIYYKKCLTLSKSINYNNLIEYCLQHLANLYEKKNKYKLALKYFKDFKTNADSVLNLKTNSKIAELQIDYETEKKDRTIAESKLKIKEKSAQLVLAGGVIIFLILISLWIYFYQLQKRKRIREELKLKSRIKQAEADKKIADEKLRVSRELHDNIGSHLTFLISSLDNLTYSKKDNDIFKKLTGLSEYGRFTLRELRNTIWAMKHQDADLRYLVLKLNEIKKDVISNLQDLNLNIVNNVELKTKLTAAQILNLFRIAQEAIQNTIKYSKASQITISFHLDEDILRMEIADDGIGFDLFVKHDGNGLKNMKFRCEELKGNFKITSSNNGTKITSSIPLNNTFAVLDEKN